MCVAADNRHLFHERATRSIRVRSFSVCARLTRLSRAAAACDRQPR